VCDTVLTSRAHSSEPWRNALLLGGIVLSGLRNLHLKLENWALLLNNIALNENQPDPWGKGYVKHLATHAVATNLNVLFDENGFDGNLAEQISKSR